MRRRPDPWHHAPIGLWVSLAVAIAGAWVNFHEREFDQLVARVAALEARR